MKKTKLHEYQCEECGKKISSLSKAQFEFNKGQHINMHKRKTRLEKLKDGTN